MMELLRRIELSEMRTRYAFLDPFLSKYFDGPFLINIENPGTSNIIEDATKVKDLGMACVILSRLPDDTRLVKLLDGEIVEWEENEYIYYLTLMQRIADGELK